MIWCMQNNIMRFVFVTGASMFSQYCAIIIYITVISSMRYFTYVTHVLAIQCHRYKNINVMYHCHLCNCAFAWSDILLQYLRHSAVILLNVT